MTDPYDITQIQMREDVDWAHVKGRCDCPDRTASFRSMIHKDDASDLIDAVRSMQLNMTDHFEEHDPCDGTHARIDVVLEPLLLDEIDVTVTVGDDE